MGLKRKIDDYLDNKKANKNSKEPERNPYFMSDYCILKDNIKHQKIGGKKGYFDRSVTAEEIVKKAVFEGNIACRQFIERRPDLFKAIQFPDLVNPSHIIKPEARDRKYHYIKIWNTNDSIYPTYCYLGYVICSDEIKKAYKVNK